MTKPIGPICNLDCKYCFYLEKEKLYPDKSNWRMPENVLERYVQQYILAQDIPEITFAWQGGEPGSADPWTVQKYQTACSERRLDLRVSEDITKLVRTNVIKCLADLLDHIPLFGKSVIEDTRTVYRTLLNCSFLPRSSVEAGLVWLEDCEELGL